MRIIRFNEQKKKIEDEVSAAKDSVVTGESSQRSLATEVQSIQDYESVCESVQESARILMKEAETELKKLKMGEGSSNGSKKKVAVTT